jgi:hypothetical protein
MNGDGLFPAFNEAYLKHINLQFYIYTALVLHRDEILLVGGLHGQGVPLLLFESSICLEHTSV